MSVMSGRGAHCDERGCHKLDFLPFTCDKCRRTFCLDHRDPSHHSCTFDVASQRVMPACPVCQQYVFVSADDSVDARVNAHILSGCKDHLMKDVQSVVKAKQSVTLRCDYVDGCSNKDGYSTMQCKKCRLQYCLSHRFPEQHKCTALTSSSTHASVAPDKYAKGKALLEKVRREKEEREAQRAASSSVAVKKPVVQRRPQTTTLQQIRAQMASVGSYIAGSIVGTTGNTEQATVTSSSSSSTSAAGAAVNQSLSPPPPTTTSSAPPPAPTTAMRKQAVGDDRIAVSDRYYWWLDTSHVRRTAASSTHSLLAVYVNKNWTVGRALDSLCELAGVENDNHVGSGRQKVCLGCERSLKGRPLPFDLPLHLLSPAVMDGDTVQLMLKDVARTPSPQPAVEVAGMGLTGT